ncbi:hypothetical protein FQR65_LT04643 [Abscondita terminalis]|nr:hypothetical protein FQR65_LT04643 [Abscondita terminalis]
MRRSVDEPKVSFLPYYGGAKGHTLKVTELSNGTVTMEIIKTETQTEPTTEIQPSDLEMPQLPQRPTRGEIDDEEESEYRENLESLHLSAEKLAEIHNRDDEEFNFSENTDLTEWLARKKSNKKDNKKKEEEKKKKEEEKRKEEEEEKRKEEEEEKRKKEEEKRKQEKEEEEKRKQEKEKEGETEEISGNDEEVVINLPPEDASVAEAKPVGLAVAGAGGIAASKPVATAVVGPGGLAVAHPIGTAIAGVSPDQALVPIYAEADDAPSSSKKDMSKEQKKKLSNTEYLNKIIQRYHKVNWVLFDDVCRYVGIVYTNNICEPIFQVQGRDAP